MQAICDDSGGGVAPHDIYVTVSGCTGCASVNGSSVCCFDSLGVSAVYIGEVGGVGGSSYPRHTVDIDSDGEVQGTAEASGSDYVEWQDYLGPPACGATGSLTIVGGYGTCDSAGTFTLTGSCS